MTFNEIAKQENKTVRTVRNWFNKHKQATGEELGTLVDGERSFTDEEVQSLLQYSSKAPSTGGFDELMVGAARQVQDRVEAMSEQSKQIADIFTPQIHRHLTGQSIIDNIMSNLGEGAELGSAADQLPMLEQSFFDDLEIAVLEAEDNREQAYNKFNEALALSPAVSGSSGSTLALEAGSNTEEINTEGVWN